MIYQIISSTELGELTIKDKLVSKYDLEVKDEEGKIERASFLGEPPAVGSVVDAEIETVVKNGRTYKNFRIHRKETELLKKEEKEEEVQHVAPVKTTQETETVTTVFPKKTRFLSNLEVRERFDFTKEEKIENGKEQSNRISR